MARSAAEARTALEYRSMVGRGQVIYIGDLEPDGGQVLTFEEADERTLTAAVRLGSEQEVRDAAAALAGKIREANPSAGQYNLFLMELVTHLMKMTRRSGVGVEEVFGTGFSLPIQDSALPSLEELEDWCAERYLRLRTLIRRRQTDSAGQTVETAKEYIRQHYAESDLSVEKLCAYLHLSSTYFSTLFKRETGTSFTAYVTTVRMEAAAEAIRGTEEKTYILPNIEIGVDFMVKENFIYVGIDLHKETHTAVMIDCYNQKLGEITFPNRPADFPKLVIKVKKCNTDAKEVVYGLENAYGYGRPLAVWLIDICPFLAMKYMELIQRMIQEY